MLQHSARKQKELQRQQEKLEFFFLFSTQIFSGVIHEIHLAIAIPSFVLIFFRL